MINNISSQAVLCIFIWVCVFVKTESQNEINMEVTQGYNTYFPLNSFFETYQKIYISDQISQLDYREYHFCFVNQVQKANAEPISKSAVLEAQQNNPNKIKFDLKQIIESDHIIASHYSSKDQIVYILRKQQINSFQISLNGSIQGVTKQILAQQTKSGSFTENKDNIYLLTDKNVFQVNMVQEQVKLKQILTSKDTQNSNSTYRWISVSDQSLYVGSKQNIVKYNLVDNETVDSLKKQSQIKLKGFGQNMQVSQMFYEAQNKILFYFQNKEIYVTFEMSFDKNYSEIDYLNFYRLYLSKRCKQTKVFGKQIMFIHENHLSYINVDQLIKCKNNLDSVKQCLRNLKFNQLNIGYYIESVDFLADHTILISGLNQYQIFDVIFSKNDTIDNRQIVQIKRAETYFVDYKIHHSFISSYNRTLVLTRSDLIVFENVKPRYEIQCRTVDSSKQKYADRPSGTFTASLFAEGICSNKIGDYQIKPIQQKNICKIKIPVSIKIVSQIKHYQFIWYILAGLAIAVLVFNCVYFFVKRKKLSQSYLQFQDQKQYGQQVIQQTMVTQQNNQQQTVQ